MATKIAIGMEGKVVCPFCGYEATFEIADVETQEGTGYVLQFDNVCKHLNENDWELTPEGTVEFTAHSDDECEWQYTNKRMCAMDKKIARGIDGKIMCTLCGQEANYQLDDLEIGTYGSCSENADLAAYSDEWIIRADNMCEHLLKGEWHVVIDGTVYVTARSKYEYE
jgi:hypothetical protein